MWKMLEGHKLEVEDIQNMLKKGRRIMLGLKIISKIKYSFREMTLFERPLVHINSGMSKICYLSNGDRDGDELNNSISI